MVTTFIDINNKYFRGFKALLLLIIINIAAWAAILLITLGGKVFGLSEEWLLNMLCVPSGIGDLLLHPWTLATYSLIHFSLLHLAFNMLWLYSFGMMLEGSRRKHTLLWLYIGAGIAGGICYAFAQTLIGPDISGNHLAGASAAVLGVITGTALLMPRRRIRLMFFGEIRLKWLANVCIALCVIGGMGGGAATQVAHLGGVAFAAMRHFYLSAKTQRKFRRNRMAQIEEDRHRNINTRATLKAINSRIPDSERLDQLLDKVRISGYDSLSAKEKTELNYISARIK